MTGTDPSNVHPLRQVRGRGAAQSTLIAVAGGKGGVGKSFVSSSLAIFLANLGQKTVLVDLDLGAANLHTCFGGPAPSSASVSDLILDPNKTLKDVCIPTQVPRLSLVSGAGDAMDFASSPPSDISRIMAALYHHPSDFIVMDLSAGTHASTLDFFLMAERQIVVVTPEPSSIENAYRFMKSCFYRKIRRYGEQLGVGPLLNEIMAQPLQAGVRSPADLLKIVLERDPVHGPLFVETMLNLEFSIILNQARTAQDVALGPSTRSVCQRYFGLPVGFLGHLDFDNAVWQSLRKRRPLLLEYPHSRLYGQFMTIARNLAHPIAQRAVV